MNITSYLIRAQIFAHGLFGFRTSDSEPTFLTADQVEDVARRLSKKYRKAHLVGDWILSLWDLQPIYTMIATDDWDDECRKRLDKMLDNDLALDGFTLMLFGAHYTTDDSLLAKIVDIDRYRERVRERLGDPTVRDAHPSVLSALKRAVGQDRE